MPDLETKITLRMGLLISTLCSLVVFVFSVLWIHQTDITLLKTNQAHVLQTLAEIKTIPVEVAKMNVTLNLLMAAFKEHERKEVVGKNR